MRKLPLALVLAFAATFITACGDDTKPADSLTAEEVICVKIKTRGGNCGNGSGSATTTTATSTVTVTQTN